METRLEILFLLTMISSHLLRRTFESFCLTRFGTSQMDVTHFLIGVLLYTTLGIIALCTPYTSYHGYTGSSIYQSIQWYQFPVLLLFIWISKHQYDCHVILSHCKKLNGKYSIPFGDWFQYVSCPHYLADILIYVCLVAMVGVFDNCYLLLPLCSTTCILTVSARNTHFWYRKQFSNYPNDRKIIFPLIY